MLATKPQPNPRGTCPSFRQPCLSSGPPEARTRTPGIAIAKKEVDGENAWHGHSQHFRQFTFRPLYIAQMQQWPQSFGYARNRLVLIDSLILDYCIKLKYAHNAYKFYALVLAPFAKPQHGFRAVCSRALQSSPSGMRPTLTLCGTSRWCQ